MKSKVSSSVTLNQWFAVIDSFQGFLATDYNKNCDFSLSLAKVKSAARVLGGFTLITDTP